MTLCEFMIEYRKSHGLSQRQFALACGLSNGYISMLEKNRNPKTGQPLCPTLPVLKKLATGMGMTLHELFEKADDISLDIMSGEQKKSLPSGIESRLGEIDWRIIEFLPDLTSDQKIFLLSQLTTFREQAQEQKSSPHDRVL